MTWTQGHRSRCSSSDNPPSGNGCAGCPGRPGPTHRHALRHATDDRLRNRDYIGHHTKIAGRSDTLFTADAITVIHNAGRGYPRAINNLGVHALTAAYAAGNPVVDEKAARAALTETATD